MPINFPSYKNLIDRNRSSVRAQLPDSDPTIFGSFLRALTDGVASRAYDLVLLIQQALNQAFPQTASGIYIERWAGYEDLERLSATPASGLVTFSGTAASSIPVNTQVTSSNGDIYTTQSGVSITATNISISSITRTGTTATATAIGHQLASGLNTTIAGAVETEYNGAFEITVLDENTFTYEISGSPATPATGTITASGNYAFVNIESQLAGQLLNADNGASFTLVSPISGVDSIAYAQANGIEGGTNTETDAQLRERVLESRSNPVANFNAASIIKQARQVSGVTQVFVKNITPNVGDVTVYFLRNNDVNPVPSSVEITAVKNKILEILPATSDSSNVYVLAPTLITTNFAFTAISPDTPTMRAAIANNLRAFFQDKAEFETDITKDQYRAAIIETQDTNTGQFLNSFTLSSPSADITISTGEIARLGNVTF